MTPAACPPVTPTTLKVITAGTPRRTTRWWETWRRGDGGGRAGRGGAGDWLPVTSCRWYDGAYVRAWRDGGRREEIHGTEKLKTESEERASMTRKTLMSPFWKSGAVMDGKEERRRRQGRQIEAGGLLEHFCSPQNPSGAVTGVTISGNLPNKADCGSFVYRSKVRSSQTPQISRYICETLMRDGETRGGDLLHLGFGRWESGFR